MTGPATAVLAAWGVPAAVIAAGLIFYLFLWRRSRGRLSRVENAALNGLIALGLLTAGLVLHWWPRSERPAVRPQVFFLVGRDVLRAAPERVTEELARVPPEFVKRVAIYADASRIGTEAAGRPEWRGFQVEASFPSLASADAWANLQGRGAAARKVVISSRSTDGEAVEGMPSSRLVVDTAPRRYINRLALPDLAFAGRTVEVTAEVSPARAGEANLVLSVDGKPAGGAVIGGEASGEPLVFDVMAGRPGRRIVSLEVADGAGRILDRQYGAMRVVDPPRVAYYAEKGAPAPLRTFLTRHGFSVRQGDPEGLAGDTLPGEGEIVVLDDLPVSRLPWNVVGRLFEAVSRNGAGLLAVGGERSFGPGYYGNTPVERLLPVWMGIKNRDREKHRTALIIILDTSGSMRCYPEGCEGDAERMAGTKRTPKGPRIHKIDSAKQAILNLIPAVKDVKYFGLLGVRDAPYWEIEPDASADRAAIEERVRKIQAISAGINLYSGLQEAFRKMDELEADIKHIVMMIDTDDLDETKVLGRGTVLDLVRQAESRNISNSIIGFGFNDDKFMPLLNQIAAASSGYLYVTSNIGEIPTFLAEDHEKLARNQVIRRPMLTHSSPQLFPGLPATPPLEGQLITEAKPDASVPVWSDIGYPVFAFRRSGKGAVGAMAADGGEKLAPAWVGDEALPAWDAILGKLLAEEAPAEKVFFAHDPGRLGVYLDAGRGGAFRSLEGLVRGRAEARPAGSFVEEHPGFYRLDLGELAAGTYVFSAAGGGTEAARRIFRVRELYAPSREEKLDYRAFFGKVAPPAPVPPRHVLRFLLILAAGLLIFYEVFREA